MNWLTRLIPTIGTSKSKSTVPDGLWSSCPACESVLYAPELEKSLFVCPKCDHHLRIGARKRLEMFLDGGVYKEIAADLITKDPLKFKDKVSSGKPSSPCILEISLLIIAPNVRSVF